MNRISPPVIQFRRCVGGACALIALGVSLGVHASDYQAWTSLSLESLAEFNAPGANWAVAGGLGGDPRVESDLVPLAGSGMLVNRPTSQAKGHLFTAWTHADLEVELDFLVPAGSNSGVYLQGRYEVQISDTWNKPRRTSHDTGGIYERWDESRPEGQKGYEGYTPLAEVERAPGLWQHLHIVFRAPRFDAKGNKTSPAHFETVELNGVLVQENKDVFGPTRAAGFSDESPQGPLMLQGDHGAVAYRNIAYRKLTLQDAPTAARVAGSLALPRVEKLRVEEGYAETSDGTRVLAVAVGSPGFVHYCYLPERSALLRMWRGPFLVESVKLSRSASGRPLTPAGSTVTIGDLPALAWLRDENAPWPDRPSPRPGPAMNIDQAGMPAFWLAAGTRTGSEQIVARADRQGLTRKVTIDESAASKNPGPGAVWLLLAESTAIARTRTGYVVGDREYYLDLPESTEWQFKVRTHGDRFQLVARAPAKAATLACELIW